MTGRRTRERRVRHERRVVPADGSTLTDLRLGYLIAGFTDKGAYARPGESFSTAMWSRDLGGRCARGQHWNCAHARDGQHEAGVPVTGADGAVHLWRCGCPCHDGPDPQAYAPRGDKWLVAAHLSAQRPPALTRHLTPQLTGGCQRQLTPIGADGCADGSTLTPQPVQLELFGHAS